MADIVFKYPEMKQAADSIKNIADRYKAAASTLESDFLASTTAWEGESKEKMKIFLQGPVMEYTRDTVPQLLNALAELLIANADQMENADKQIAENIPTSLN